VKLIRYGAPGSERPGCVDRHGQIYDLSAWIPDLSRDNLDPEVLAELSSTPPERLPRVEPGVRLGPCVGDVSKIVCIGLNYADHAAESGVQVPDRPTLFLKSQSAISGPNDPVIFPRRASAVDWEVELAVVLGKSGAYIGSDEALEFVAGYCVANDISERCFSEEGGGQWTKGKSADTFSPIGPWLVTKDEVPDPQSLGMWLEVNGIRMQDSNSCEMVVGVAELISYVSEFMTLKAGDLILTGTPAGTAYGRGPAYYLKPGDILRLGIERLGVQEMEVLAPQQSSCRIPKLTGAK
jgi:2-keto-4-pentenoate hydratase/2-oxohepta-3-ene-1,7-dioic acid hydratase in catechol pathway